MPQCPNCGRKTHHGTYCLWCHYPLIRHRFTGYSRKKAQLAGTTEQSRIPAEQTINDIRQKARIEDEEESTRIISSSEQISDQLIRNIKEQIERESRRILEEAVEKISKETEDKDRVPVISTKNAVVQGYQQDQPLPGGTLVTGKRRQNEARKIPITGKTRVFIVDQDFFFCQGLQRYLSRSDDIEVIGISEAFVEDTVLTAAKLHSEVALVDIDLPSSRGFDLAQQLDNCFPAIPVIILTPHTDDEQILRALKSGAMGYLGKDTSAEGFASAIRRVSAEEYIINHLLTIPGVARKVQHHFQGIVGAEEGNTGVPNGQEMAVLGYLADGYTSEQVADTLVMSSQTIEEVLASIRRKLLISAATSPDDPAVAK